MSKPSDWDDKFSDDHIAKTAAAIAKAAATRQGGGKDGGSGKGK